MIKIKICCIKNIKEAELAIKYGADAIGLVSEMPSGPGVISENEICKIAEFVPENIKTFLLTSKQSSIEIIEQLKRCKTNTVQIVDKLKIGSYFEIKKALPNVDIIQVIHVLDESTIQEAVKISTDVDGLLLDSGNPNLKTKVLGGTGKTHNWELSREICKRVDVPVFLAGGLNPKNVNEAIKVVNPSGVDICSGIRTNGNLDKKKLADYVKNVHSIIYKEV